MTAANLEALGSFFFFLATCGESLLLSLLLLVVQLHVLGLFGIVPLVPWRGWGEGRGLGALPWVPRCRLPSSPCHTLPPPGDPG